MNNSRSGIVFVVCAPSGAGKSTLLHRLLSEFTEPAFSVSCTTRAPRTGEVNDLDYHFISKEKFEWMKQQNNFAEWAEVHGNFYGTPLKPVQDALTNGRDIVFDIDVQGARQLKERFPEGRYVFIFPPSLSVLRQRLTGRATDSPEAIQGRLAGALGEIRQADFFDAWIINEELDQAYDQLRSVYVAATLAPRCRPNLIRDLLSE